jgi:hypothetical protein
MRGTSLTKDTKDFSLMAKDVNKSMNENIDVTIDLNDANLRKNI